MLLISLYGGIQKLTDPSFGTQINVVLNGVTTFPTVTYCQDNLYRKSYLERHPVVLTYLMRWYPEIAQVLTDNMTLLDLANTIEEEDDIGQNITDDLIAASHPFQDTILKHVMYGKRMISPDIFQPVLTQLGMCYQFRVNWTTRRVGKMAGLETHSLVSWNDYFYSELSNGEIGIRASITHFYRGLNCGLNHRQLILHWSTVCSHRLNLDQLGLKQYNKIIYNKIIVTRQTQRMRRGKIFKGKYFPGISPLPHTVLLSETMEKKTS